jgi:hypothetical protein
MKLFENFLKKHGWIKKSEIKTDMVDILPPVVETEITKNNEVNPVELEVQKDIDEQINDDKLKLEEKHKLVKQVFGGSNHRIFMSLAKSCIVVDKDLEVSNEKRKKFIDKQKIAIKGKILKELDGLITVYLENLNDGKYLLKQNEELCQSYNDLLAKYQSLIKKIAKYESIEDLNKSYEKFSDLFDNNFKYNKNDQITTK